MVNRYAIIKDGVVTDIAMSEPEFAQEQGWVLAPDEAGSGWTYNGSIFSPLPPPKLPTLAQLSDLRATAYAQEADPLFFMAQRGEATLEEWQAKVAEIKARFPYPSE